MADHTDSGDVADPGPGVHLVVHPDPRSAAKIVAGRLGAVVVDNPALAEAVVAQRARLHEARVARERLGRLEALAARIDPAADPVADAALVDQLPELRQRCARRPPEPADAERLRSLGREVAAFAAVLDGTRQGVHRQISGQLGRSAHEADAADLRRLAAAVEEAEAAEADARQAPTPPPTPAPTPTMAAPVEPDPDGVDRSDGSVLLPLGVLSLGLCLACVVLILRLPPAAAAVPVLVAVLLASVVRRTIKAGPMAAAVPGAPAATVVIVEAAEEQGPGHQAEAQARVAAARAAWHERAGPDADPRQAEALLAWPDPGDDDRVTDLVAAAPAVRAAATCAGAARARWDDAWAELGWRAPEPDEAAVAAALADLADRSSDRVEAEERLIDAQAAAERVRARADLADALGEDDLEGLRAATPDEQDLDDAPLVLVEPFTDLGRKRRKALRRLLDELDADLQVVVVVRSSEEVPSRSG